MIPATSAAQLTTSTLNVLLPGLVSHYGAGQPVDLHIQVVSLHDFQIYAGNQEMDCITTLEVQFWVHTVDGGLEMAADLILKDVQVGLIAPITNMSLVIDITRINVGSVTVVSDTIGKLSGVLIKSEINNGFKVAQPSLNAFLATKPFNFPTSIFGLFELHGLTLSYYDSYLYVGISPVFIGLPSAAYE